MTSFRERAASGYSHPLQQLIEGAGDVNKILSKGDKRKLGL